MNPPDKPREGNDEPPPKLSRSEEALRIIEEYADHLRAIIKKLRGRLHWGRDGPEMMARIGMMRALNRQVERVFDA